jgi:DNA-binding transcriptional MocR family regulator
MCGVDTVPERIAVFPGAQGAISSVLLSLFRPGDAIAVDGFTYANFISLARLAHLKLVAVASDENGMSPLALAEAADKDRVKGVFLMPRDANPTCITLSEKRKTEIANTVLAKNLLLMEDDARLLPPQRGEKTLFARIPEQTVYIAGSTRNIAPGLRATFMAFPGRCTGRILNALHHLTIKAGALDAEILAELILSGRAMRILKTKAEKAFAANRLFDEIFPSAPKASPTALFRVLPFPGTSGRGQETEAAYRAAGVDVCHSDRFSVKPGQADSFLRVSLSSATSISRLRRGLKVLANA